MSKKEEKDSKLKTKFVFNYRNLKPDDNSSIEYSFEELRAIEYNRRYEIEQQARHQIELETEAKYKEHTRKLEEENRRLKEKLARSEQIDAREEYIYFIL